MRPEHCTDKRQYQWFFANLSVLPVFLAFKALVASSALSGTSDTVKLGITGIVGIKGAPNTIQIGNDGGLAAPPLLPAMDMRAGSLLRGAVTDFLTLSQNGVGHRQKNVTVTGAGNVTLYSDGAGGNNWQNLKTIDLSGSSGNVMLTGASLGNGSASLPTPGQASSIIPYEDRLRAGLVETRVDLTSMTAAQLAAMTRPRGAASGSASSRRSLSATPSRRAQPAR